MATQRRESEYLLHLIICSLGNAEPREDEGVDFRALFELAKKQEIYCVINDKLQSLSSVPKDVKTLFRNQTLSELNRMIAIGAERNIILSKLSESKIKFMPLKGLIFKNYYPKESMRQMSDNDILIDESKRSEAARIMEELSYNAYDTTQNSDDFHKKPYYTFELHRSLFDPESEFSPRFDTVWENALQDENNEYMFHMAKNDVYVYSICHMYKHYIKCCCGLRFLLDNYLFLKAENENLNWEYIYSELEKYGLSEYEKQTRELSFKLFEEGELTEEEMKLLRNYSEFGLFGDEEGKIIQKYDAAALGTSKEGTKIKYIYRRLFPGKRDMLYNYPILEKKPYLLPLMIIHRFFKGIFNYKKTADELKSVKQIQKEN